MGSFTIRPLGLIVLFSFLVVITLILILPQVDLLDTAFQRNTSPLAIRARSTSAPATVAGMSASRMGFETSPSVRRESARESGYPKSGERVEVLNQSFRC